MPIHAIIIDDERLARTELKRMLAEENDIVIIGEASNAAEATIMVEEHRPDLIFLDIQMPGKNGFEFLEELDATPEVIFTTAYDEYAIKAFDVNALDYLQKPLDSTRLHEAIKKVKQHQATVEKTKDNNAKNMLQSADRFFVKDGEKCWFVKLSDVRLFESSGNYTKVYFEKHKPLVLKSLNALEERLDPKTFFRCSRKHIVNINWIENIESYFNGGLLLRLNGGEEIEVSRRQTARFKEIMSL